jgi:hypothetical protein
MYIIITKSYEEVNYQVLTKILLDAESEAAPFFAGLELYEQYAAASYCPANTATAGQKLKCAVGNCPLVEAADTKIIKSISK